MKDTFRITVLCFVAGAMSGLLTIFLACQMGYIFWSAIGIASFALAVFLALTFAHWFRWITIEVTRKQFVAAAIITACSYPVSIIAMFLAALKRLYLTANMRGSLAFELFSYSTLFRTPVSQVFEERSVMISGLTLAVILGAFCLVISLRIITRRWDKRVLVLMLIAVGVTPVLNYAISFELRQGLGASIEEFLISHSVALVSSSLFIYPEPVLFCYNDSVLHIFILGNAFFAALSAYWLKRAFPH